MHLFSFQFIIYLLLSICYYHYLLSVSQVSATVLETRDRGQNMAWYLPSRRPQSDRGNSQTSRYDREDSEGIWKQTNKDLTLTGSQGELGKVFQRQYSLVSPGRDEQAWALDVLMAQTSRHQGLAGLLSTVGLLTNKEGLWGFGRRHGNPLQDSCPEDSHGQRSLVGYSPRGLQRVRHDWATKPSRAEQSTWGSGEAHCIKSIRASLLCISDYLRRAFIFPWIHQSNPTGSWLRFLSSTLPS